MGIGVEYKISLEGGVDGVFTLRSGCGKPKAPAPVYPLLTITSPPPLTFTSPQPQNLNDYKIYGKTSNGASVGDPVSSGEHQGEYVIPVTVAKTGQSSTKNIYLSEPLHGAHVYGFRFNSAAATASDAIEYLGDAVGKTPAAMGANSFSYGDWADAFFMPRPCMLKYDGTVDYYLDPNDYTKRIDISIPDSYKPVNYLKRTGNNVSYINTDIYISSYATTKADLAIKFENWYSSNDNTSYIGANGGGERDIWVSNKSGSRQDEIFFWNGRGLNEPIVSIYATLSGPLLNTHLGADYFAVNDSKASVTPTPVETVLPGYPIVIFGRNNNGTIEAYNKTDLTIYNVVIRDVVNGAETITHFLIPAERQSDSKLGLYDAVTDVFYPATGTFTKGEYGIKSDCDNIHYGGNAMMEWPKIWYKFEAGENPGEGYFYVSDTKVDNTYHCWCNYDALDNEIEHFYTAIYNSPSNTTLRSLSGKNLPYWDPFLRSLNERAHANNVNGYVEWQLEVFADRQLIDALIMLIGKSANVTSVFGNGLYGQSGSAQTLLESYTTGTLNDKGLFWGDTSSGNNAVKIFGMENWWGLQSRVVNGILYVIDPAAKLYYKLTYGTADGSEATGYNTSSINQFLSINTNAAMDRDTGYITALTFANGVYYPSWVSSTNNIWNWKFKPYVTYPQASKLFTYGGNIWDSVRSPNGIALHYSGDDDYTFGGNLCCKPIAAESSTTTQSMTRSADYLDYGEGKRYNMDGTESAVTLPDISLYQGQNTLSVGTTIQPSEVSIKGRGIAETD